MSGVVPVNYILYADDDADDQEFMRELLPQIIPNVQLVIKNNGIDLLRFLKNLPADREMPALIILDLNMPLFDGIQTLMEIKSNERYHNVPVMIFSTTSNDIDRHHALSAGAVAFVTKPSGYLELQTIIKSFTAYFNQNK